jgi:hypothetical protein
MGIVQFDKPIDGEKQLNYSIDLVKLKIAEVVSLSNGKYQFIDKNDAFNIYTVLFRKNQWQMLQIRVTLKSQDNTTTIWSSRVSLYKGAASEIDFYQSEAEFVALISKAITGEALQPADFNTHYTKRLGCYRIFVISLVVILLVTVLITCFSFARLFNM